MEKVYRKVIKGKKTVYEPVGYSHSPDLPDGIWLIQSTSSCKSMSSLVWRVGDLKRPTDIITHASLQTMESDLSTYLIRLSDGESDEFKEAKETIGWTLTSPVVYNCSIASIVTLFIREISKKLEDIENICFDGEIHKFRETLDNDSPDFGIQARVLNDLAEWFANNKYIIKKMNE